MTRLLLTIILACILISQDTRYVDEVFDSVDITQDVVYGNAPDLPFWFWVESNTEDIDLDMDIYEPAGDTLEKRPAIVFIHTGAFFSGHNELDDVVDLSIASAKRGYVAVNINYRLGLNIIGEVFDELYTNTGLSATTDNLEAYNMNLDVKLDDDETVCVHQLNVTYKRRIKMTRR